MQVIQVEMLSLMPTSDSPLGNRIACARSLETLWFLRIELFNVIALQHGEQVARRRCAEVTALFE